jgi:hypothetical protein
MRRGDELHQKMEKKGGGGGGIKPREYFINIFWKSIMYGQLFILSSQGMGTSHQVAKR